MSQSRFGCCVGSTLILLILLGAGLYIGMPQFQGIIPNWGAVSRNTEYDAEMDRLGAALNQDAEQWPAFQEETAEKQAIDLYRDAATPLAARCVSHGLQQSTPSMSLTEIRDVYQKRWAWAWKYRGREDIVPESAQGGTPAGGGPGEEKPAYTLQGYENVSLPPSMTEVRLPLEHYHFAYFLPEKRRYWGSFSFESEELLGTDRIYVLKQITDGSATVLDVFEALPSYDESLAMVRARLKGTVP